MITHVVLWKIKPELNKEEVIPEAKRCLCSMLGKIPGLLSVKAGENLFPEKNGFDLALITNHESQQALEEYFPHPIHQEVASFIKEIVVARASIDFESVD